MTSAPSSPATPLGADAVTWLSAFLVLLLALPAQLVVVQLGSMGSPATLIGLALVLWWGWHHLHRDRPIGVGVQPVRWAALGVLLAVLVSYAWAMIQPIPSDDISPGDSALLRLISLLGLVLVANDGIQTPLRMHRVVTFLVVGAAAVSMLAIVQFVTGQLWVDRIEIPGLSASTSLVLGDRQGLTRPSGTATHAIEFASFLTMVLPLAIMDARTRMRRHPAWILLIVVITGAALLSLSRTAILCLVVGIAIITPALPRLWRMFVAIGAAAMVLAAGVLVPGLIGTLRGLFLSIGEDSSVQSRTSSYSVALDYFERNPIFGTGVGTFLPKYWILDNMYLQFALEAGLLGLLALLGLLVTALVVAKKASSLLPEGPDRDITIGLIGAISAGAVSFAFFDGLSFPQASCTLFLLVGMAGAYWRIARQAPFVPRVTPVGQPRIAGHRQP